MVEINDVLHIHQSPGIQSVKGFQSGLHYEVGIKCEDCPAEKICKKIGNFRNSCEPNMTNYQKDMGINKCIVATNILLAKLLEK